jgi:hypothetical protein
MFSWEAILGSDPDQFQTGLMSPERALPNTDMTTERQTMGSGFNSWQIVKLLFSSLRRNKLVFSHGLLQGVLFQRVWRLKREADHLCLEPRIRMSGSMPLLPYMSPWCTQG